MCYYTYKEVIIITDINTRLVELRKNILNLTQAEFSSRILLAQTHLSSLENGTRNVTDRTIADICREFNVNELWLRTGEGEVFVERSPENLELIAKEYNLSDLSKAVMAKFLEMDGEQRDNILSFARVLLKDAPDNTNVIEIVEPVQEEEKEIFQAARSSNHEPAEHKKLSEEEHAALGEKLANAKKVTRFEDL